MMGGRASQHRLNVQCTCYCQSLSVWCRMPVGIDQEAPADGMRG